MNIFYFSEENLKNTFFIKEFVSAFREKPQKGILLHGSFGSLVDTRFVTKRLSAVMSELMIVNNAFSGDQRNLLALDNGSLEFRVDLVKSLLETVDLVILNTIVSGQNGPESGNAHEIVALLRQQLPIEELILFARNSKSPMVQSKITVDPDTDLSSLLNLYDEEQFVLETAQALAPASIASPANFAS